MAAVARKTEMPASPPTESSVWDLRRTELLASLARPPQPAFKSSGQLTALALILLFMQRWRASPSFGSQAYTANVIMIGLGAYLMGFQLIGLALA